MTYQPFKKGDTRTIRYGSGRPDRTERFNGNEWIYYAPSSPPCEKTRAEAVEYIEKQFNDEVPRLNSLHHYGRQELRQLMDYLYGCEPMNDSERVKGSSGA